MSSKIARVTGDLDQARGADVQHRIRVPDAWLAEGATVEFELPRNLTCAACEGGGCDACDRAGAISVRERSELGEIVRVVLPCTDDDGPLSSHSEPPSSGKRGLIVRIPDQGGLPPSGSDLPRGHLMLLVQVGEPVTATRVEIPVAPAPQPAAFEPAIVAAARKRPVALVVVAVLVLGWIALLVAVRMSGCG